MRGYPDQALHQQQEALRLAQELAHPYTLICALDWGAWLHQFRREGPATQAQAEMAMPISSEYGFVEWLAHEQIRSEERRVGKECRSRWSPYH